MPACAQRTRPKCLRPSLWGIYNADNSWFTPHSVALGLAMATGQMHGCTIQEEPIALDTHPKPQPADDADTFLSEAQAFQPPTPNFSSPPWPPPRGPRREFFQPFRAACA
eukprot:3950175-Pyramimonas_sp.AAC.1